MYKKVRVLTELPPNMPRACKCSRVRGGAFNWYYFWTISMGPKDRDERALTAMNNHRTDNTGCEVSQCGLGFSCHAFQHATS